MTNCSGYLTIYSADRSEIYGEFADANWTVEQTAGGVNNVFSGIAGDGTLSTFQRIDEEGISHVAYTFEADGNRYEGAAQLLATRDTGKPGETIIRIETGETPVL
jgi:hypothetical protein